MVFIAKSLDQAKKSHGSDYTVAQILLISWGYMRTKTRNYESTTQVWVSIGWNTWLMAIGRKLLNLATLIVQSHVIGCRLTSFALFLKTEQFHRIQLEDIAPANNILTTLTYLALHLT